MRTQELIKLMLEVCLDSNNKDCFTEEQLEILEKLRGRVTK